jgi:DNA-binding IclR family transcriptional regulator
VGSSATRVLRLLDLFTVERPFWTADAVMQEAGLTRPTAFRYLRELVEAGLLTRFGDGHYRLGARCAQLDWQIRVGDPLLAAAVPEMAGLRDLSGCGVTLVGLTGGQVIGLHLEEGPMREAYRYGRGRPMPRFLGSPSKMLIASLPAERQRALYRAHAEEAAAGGLGDSWDTFKARLNAIRRQGWVATAGELQPDLGGIAVPVHAPAGEVLAAMTIVYQSRRAAVLDHAALRRMLLDTAQRVALRLRQQRVTATASSG